MMMCARKSADFVVSAAFMTKEDSSRLAVGGSKSTNQEITFLIAAKYLQDEGFGVLKTETITTGQEGHGRVGHTRHFFVFKDFEPVLAASENRHARLADFDSMMLRFGLTYETYVFAMTNYFIDFTAMTKMCSRNYKMITHVASGAPHPEWGSQSDSQAQAATDAAAEAPTDAAAAAAELGETATAEAAARHNEQFNQVDDAQAAAAAAFVAGVTGSIVDADA